MRFRPRALLLAGAAALVVSAAAAQVTVNGVPSIITAVVKIVWNGQDISAANPLPVTGVGGPGSSAASPSYSAPAGVNIARISCTLPAYSAGGNAVCTDSSGNQTTTACAANAACQIAAANPARKYAFAAGATPGASVSLGYTANAAPGNSRAVDGPSAVGGQGGFYEWQSPPTNAIYAASATSGAVVVFEQGQ